jgi:hypothetical protein
MCEVVVTIVTQETVDEMTYPITSVCRIEFNNEAALRTWVEACVDNVGEAIFDDEPHKVTNVERLVAK